MESALNMAWNAEYVAATPPTSPMSINSHIQTLICKGIDLEGEKINTVKLIAI